MKNGKEKKKRREEKLFHEFHLRWNDDEDKAQDILPDSHKFLKFSVSFRLSSESKVLVKEMAKKN